MSLSFVKTVIVLILTINNSSMMIDGDIERIKLKWYKIKAILKEGIRVMYEWEAFLNVKCFPQSNWFKQQFFDSIFQ